MGSKTLIAASLTLIAVGAAILVLSRNTSTHGDGIEPNAHPSQIQPPIG